MYLDYQNALGPHVPFVRATPGSSSAPDTHGTPSAISRLWRSLEPTVRETSPARSTLLAASDRARALEAPAPAAEPSDRGLTARRSRSKKPLVREEDGTYRQPPGRTPNGKVWDGETGKWVDEE